MKIISYNVNGIRAAINKGFIDWLAIANPDVICLQEIKAMEEQLDLSLFENAGYNFNYWYSAQKKGYSGVAILCKKEPTNIEYGIGIKSMDFEGRNLRVDFGDLSIMSMYLPSGTNDARLNFKFNYMDEIKDYLTTLRTSRPNLVVCGDYNICHQEIDIHNPKMKGVSGFLPEERHWLGEFVDSGFIDSFRYLNPELQQYSWWSYRANSRANNKGWRLDYAMVTRPLKKMIKRAVILTEAVHSDHCPILLEIDK
jgi:exodeoxyribonuclease-3